MTAENTERRALVARPRSATAVIAVLGALYTVGVLVATIRPMPWATSGNETPGGILNPAAWTDESAWVYGQASEIVLNVLMFVPIGLAAGLLFSRAAAILLPIGLTVGIEILQIPMPDRISHPRDLVANTAGAVLGLIIARVIRHRMRWRRT